MGAKREREELIEFIRDNFDSSRHFVNGLNVRGVLEYLMLFGIKVEKGYRGGSSILRDTLEKIIDREMR